MSLHSARIIISVLFCASVLEGQSFYKYQNNENKVQSGFENYTSELSYIAQNTFDPGKYPLWQTLVLSGLTLSFVFGNDIEMHEHVSSNKEFSLSGIPAKLAPIGEIYDNPGPLYFTLGLVGSMYGTGKIFNDSRLISTTSLMLHSLVITSIFTTSLKIIIGRARPYVKHDPHRFNPLSFKSDGSYSSMPSGHTASIFSMMTVIAEQYKSAWVKVPAYTFAVSVGMQRINKGKHWASDVLLGGVIGYLIGKTVVDRDNGTENSLTIRPGISKKSVGLFVNF